MSVRVKICGLNDEAGVDAAVAGGAAFLGFNFYPRSPRFVTPARAGALATGVPAAIVKVGLLVDADDATIDATLAAAALDMLQLHGRETPARTAELRRRTGLPMMKVLPVAEAADVAAAAPYLDVADWLMFDARPPKDPTALPGGNGLPFDWRLLAGRTWPLPWMLAGGLTAATLAAAVAATGATVLDVSSGVEDGPGVKSPEKIRAFLAAAQAI
ncbi:MAG: phosphoribosylanthranilate isomerase [Alphaproteobacteria bacterium]